MINLICIIDDHKNLNDNSKVTDYSYLQREQICPFTEK